MFSPSISLRNVFTCSSSLPRKLSAAVITSTQIFRCKMRKSTTEKHIPPQIPFGALNNCLEVLLNAFVQSAYMLKMKKKMSNELSPSPQVLIRYFWIKPTSLQQADKNLVGFSPSTFLHCPTAQFSCFCIKNCEILICAIYADNNKKKETHRTPRYKVSLMIFPQKHAGQPFCILWFHPGVLRPPKSVLEF